MEGHLDSPDLEKKWSRALKNDFDTFPPGVYGDSWHTYWRGDIPKYLKAAEPEFYKALMIWNNYKAGYLPYSGGLMEQPVNIIVIITLFNSVYSKWEKLK